MPELMLHGRIGFCHPAMVSPCLLLQLERCRLHQSLHRRIRFPRVWCIFQWSLDQRPLATPPACSTQWQELFATLAAAFTWGHLLSGQRIRFHCDNLPIIQAWASQASKHPGIMNLLRTWFFPTAQHSFTVSLNSIADAISRNQMSRCFTLAPQANRCSTPLPPLLAEL